MPSDLSPGRRPGAGRLYLIDGSSQLYRAFHAIRDLTAPDGQPTNAVYGFVTMLRKLLADHDPDLVAAAFDTRGPTFRTGLDAEYKANRPSMPDDLARQAPVVHEACEALGVPILTHADFEADDVIGTLAEQARAAGCEVAIVTGDKDFYQLVRDGVRIFNPRDEGAWFDAGGVEAKFGVAPDKVIDVLALMGDAVDNVKGVPGIGEKGARELIAAHGSLDALLADPGRIARKRYRTALEQHAEDARLSRELVRIRTDVPVRFDAAAFRYRGPDAGHCFRLFSQLGFRTLAPDYAPTVDTVATDYRIARTLEEVEALVDEARAGGRCSLFVLVDDDGPQPGSLVGVALSTAPGRGCYVPLGHATLAAEAPLDAAAALAALRPLLSGSAVRKVGHDLKRAALALARHGLPLGGLADDTLLGGYLLDATRPPHRLEDLAIEHLGYKALAEDELRGRGARARSFRDLPAAAVVQYCNERSDLALQLADPLRRRLADEGLDPLYRDLELPLIPVLAAIEQAGVRIDTDVLARMSARLEADLAALQRDIHALAGIEFNVNSPKQLAEVLFEKLQLPSSRRTGKTRVASTSVAVLEELAAAHDLPRKVLEWRSLQKLKGTYIDALPQLVNPRTGRVHTSFNQAVAATGRLSSSDPNLQNIPIRTELGRRIRGAFVAPPGAVLISADYSQIELRVLAHLSRDDNLIAAFERGEDIHDRTALEVFGPDSGLDPHELRRRAKIINYALLYGKTAFTLARDIGVGKPAAQAFIDAYFSGFPGVRRYIDETLARARESGVVSTLLGRRRRVPELRSGNAQVRAAAERAAVNLPIQGTAADILKRAMIDIHGNLPPAARMILTVHDELLIEAPEELAEAVAAEVRERMERAVPLAAPLTVDVGIGRSWKEAKG